MSNDYHPKEEWWLNQNLNASFPPPNKSRKQSFAERGDVRKKE